MKAEELLEETEPIQKQVKPHLREVADWFHNHEGDMFKREEAAERVADEFDLDDDLALHVVRNLVSDVVDPIVQVSTRGTKYVGVVEFKEFDGAYGYVDYDDVKGKRKRVVCAQCVHEAEYDTEVAHATQGVGSFCEKAQYVDLISGIHKHYERAHDKEPEKVETGASLVSGTTIGGNEAWHAGNDGSGSGLIADDVAGFSHTSLTNVTQDQHVTHFTEAVPTADSVASYEAESGSKTCGVDDTYTGSVTWNPPEGTYYASAYGRFYIDSAQADPRDVYIAVNGNVMASTTVQDGGTGSTSFGFQRFDEEITEIKWYGQYSASTTVCNWDANIAYQYRDL